LWKRVYIYSFAPNVRSISWEILALASLQVKRYRQIRYPCEDVAQEQRSIKLHVWTQENCPLNILRALNLPDWS
jgi:hypothetical protein